MKIKFNKPLVIFLIFSSCLCINIENFRVNSLDKDVVNTKPQRVFKSDSLPSLAIITGINSEIEGFNLDKKISKTHKTKHLRKGHNIKKKHHFDNENNKDDSFMEISVYLFVPLVVFILIATVASIAGFLYLFINFSTSNINIEEKTSSHNRKNLHEIITILRLKNQVTKKKKKEKTECNYKHEPESEAKVLNL